MLRRRLLAGAVVAPGLCAAAGASAQQIIYNGGAPDQYNAYAADQDYVWTEDAVTFSLAAGANTIATLNWWGDCGSIYGITCPTTNDFTIYFYSDDGGTPGTLLDSYNVGNAVDQTATGKDVYENTYPEYSYSAAIPDLTLTAGVTYFLGISDDTANDYIWSWETSDQIGSHEEYNTGQYAPYGWNSQPDELAFNLEGPAPSPPPPSPPPPSPPPPSPPVPAPEPASVTLFAAGLAGLGFFRRRRRA